MTQPTTIIRFEENLNKNLVILGDDSKFYLTNLYSILARKAKSLELEKKRRIELEKKVLLTPGSKRIKPRENTESVLTFDFILEILSQDDKQKEIEEETDEEEQEVETKKLSKSAKQRKKKQARRLRNSNRKKTQQQEKIVEYEQNQDKRQYMVHMRNFFTSEMRFSGKYFDLSLKFGCDIIVKQNSSELSHLTFDSASKISN